MRIEKQFFGEYQGQAVDLFILENETGMVVKLTNFGGIITAIQLPESDGSKVDVVCGFDNFSGYFEQDYVNNSPYFGGIIGRYAARIKDGKFSVDGQDYQVATNDGPNHLHGGIVGFDKRIWQAQPIEESDAVGVALSLLSEDGDEGYPGEVKVTVEYRLTQSNALQIRYNATTTAATPLSLTNHSYFNLSGFERDIKDHQLTMAAKAILLPDETNVPVGEQAMPSGVEDFASSQAIRGGIEQLPVGFEHYYIFDSTRDPSAPVAIVKDPQSGRSLTVTTTEPGTLFYSGHYTSDSLARESGQQYGQYRAMCFETSRYPNGPNIAGAPDSILQPDQVYQQQTEFKFAW